MLRAREQSREGLLAVPWRDQAGSSMTMIPALERFFIHDLIRRGEREGRKIEMIRDKTQFKVEKKNHAGRGW